MKYRVFYLAAPDDPAHIRVPVVIDTRTADDALAFAVAVARSHPWFRDWCRRVEIHDEVDMVRRWEKDPVVVEA